MASTLNKSPFLRQLGFISLSISAAFTSPSSLASEPPSLQPQLVFSSYFNKKTPQYVLKYWPVKFADYEKGLKRLEEFYLNRLKQATKEDKYFLESEYKALIEEMQDTEKSFAQFYNVIQSRADSFKKVEQIFPDRVGMKIRHAIQDADNQYKVVQLINSTRRAVKLTDKASAEAEYQLGNVAYDNLDFKRALQHFQNAVKLNRNNSQYLNALGRILQKLGEEAVAKQLFQQAKQSSVSLLTR